MSILDRFFDVNAMAQPKTQADIVALLKEANAELENLQSHFDVVESKPKSSDD